MILLNLMVGFVLAGSPTRTVKFSNGVRLQVEIASTETDRAVGLMNRTKLDANSGMLFVFENPQILSFWMKDTFIDLSIGYFDDKFILKEIHHMTSQKMMEKNQDLRSYSSQCFCKYAIEVNKGWFALNKIKVGDKFFY